MKSVVSMTRLFVTVKTKAKKVGATRIDETHFKVAVKEAPDKGKANEAVIKALAKFLGVAPSHLTIASGHTSRQKVIEINV